MCTQDHVQEILHTVTDAARERYGMLLQCVILYGSYARGDYDEESDIDVLVLVKQAQQDPFPFADIAAALLLQYGVLVSIVVKDTAQFEKYKDILPYYQAIQKEGIVYG